MIVRGIRMWAELEGIGDYFIVIVFGLGPMIGWLWIWFYVLQGRDRDGK